MSAPFIITNPIFQAFVKGTDLPLVSGLVQFYLAGTTTPQAVFSDPACTIPLPNPVVLDANGRMDGIYGNSIYDVYISDSNSVLQDTILSVSWSPAASAGGINTEWEPVATSFTFVDAKTFTVPGNQTIVFMPSRRIQTTNTAGIITGTIISSTFSSGPNKTTVVVENDSGALDSGLSSAAVDILSTPRGTPIDQLPTLGGGTTAYTVSIQRAPKIAGSIIRAIVNATNTDASTLAVNGNTGVAITKQGSNALVAGDMQIGAVVELEYDGTEWQLLNPYIVASGQLPSGTISGNSLSGIGSSNAVILAAVEASSANIAIPAAGVWLIRASANALLGSAGSAIGVLEVTIGGVVAGKTSSIGNSGDWPSQGDYVEATGSLLVTVGAPGNIAIAATHTGSGSGIVGTPVVEADAIRVS